MIRFRQDNQPHTYNQPLANTHTHPRTRTLDNNSLNWNYYCHSTTKQKQALRRFDRLYQTTATTTTTSENNSNNGK